MNTTTTEEIAKEAASELVYRIQEPDAWKRFDPMQREELTTIILTAARRIAAGMEHPDSIALRAWQEAFGTSQLTHALARVESAERKAAQMVRDSGAELALASSASDLEYWVGEGRVPKDSAENIAHAMRKALAKLKAITQP